MGLWKATLPNGAGLLSEAPERREKPAGARERHPERPRGSGGDWGTGGQELAVFAQTTRDWSGRELNVVEAVFQRFY